MKAHNKTIKGLSRRNGIFQYRKMIPAALRSIAGKREFLISLKTENYNTAIQRYSEVSEAVECMLASMKNGSYQKLDKDFQYYARLAISQGRSLQCIKQLVANSSELHLTRSELEAVHKNKKLTPDIFRSFVSVQNYSLSLSELTDYYAELNKVVLKDLNSREYSRKINAKKIHATN